MREGKVYKGPGKWSTWSPHLAPITLWMAMKIYPQNFRDINFDMIAGAFHEKVFGIPYDKLKNLVKAHKVTLTNKGGEINYQTSEKESYLGQGNL